MSRLMIICPYFPPSAASGSFRILGFARHLPTFDWQVSVVASGPLPWQSNDPNLTRDIPAATDVTYVDFPLERQRSLWGLGLQYLRIVRGMYFWNAPALAKCKRIIELSRPDAILTSGPPHTVHMIGLALQRRYRLPWFADFRDPWCSWGSEVHYGRKYGGVSQLWERRVFNRADLIVANTPRSAEMYSEVYPASASRIIAIPNGYDPVPSSRSNVRSNADLVNVVHTGAIYLGRDPRPVANAIAMINAAGLIAPATVRMTLIGECLDQTLKSDLQASHLGNCVEMCNPMSHRDANEAMSAADILLLLDTPQRRIGVPAKLYEYVGSGRPVLALAEQDSDTALVLRNSGVSHRVVSDWTPDNLRDAIVSLSNEIRSGVAENRVASVDYTRRESVRQLAQAMDSKLEARSMDVSRTIGASECQRVG